MTLTVDFDSLPRTFYMPTGGSVTVRFIDKSSTTNGVVNSWAWTFGDTGTSSSQNPSHTYSAAGTYDVSLTCNDSGGTGATAVTKTGWIKIEAGTFTPPAQNTAFRNISIFVYERSSETAPKGTCICRAKTAACNLFFSNLLVQGYLTKAGKATFDVTNAGGGTSDEIDLFESGTVGRYKNVAIIAGYDVIWSGKLTIANKELLSQPGTSPQKATYHCEAYSDIKKLADWNILAANQSAYTGKSPGQLAALICTINSGEPDFIGTRGGFVDPNGAALQMTLSDVDKLTAFSTLTAATDYDWRTRMETMLFQYATFNGSDTITITSAGLTTNALVGSWILFPTENYLLSGASTANYVGVVAWGRITANDATTITASVSGASAVPTAMDKCLIVQVPRLDFASDLSETTPVRSFTNNVNIVKFANNDTKDDLFTKIIAKGMLEFTPALQSNTLGTSTSISVALAAKDAWNSSAGFFNNSTYITFKTMGYVHSIDTTNKYIYLIGQNFALKTSETVDVVWGVPGSSEGARYTISAIAAVTHSDGSLVTRLTISSTPSSSIPKYAFVTGSKIYVKDGSITSATSGSPERVNVGWGTMQIYAGSTDTTYGPYVSIYSYMSITGTAGPHFPGCLISKRTYDESSPESGSPVQKHGIITKPLTASTSVTIPDLEVSATAALLQGSQYYQKSTATIGYFQFTINRVRDGVQLTGPVFIREGQRISVVPSTGITAIERQIIAWELDASKMTISLTLGDYIKDVWNFLDGNTTATQKALI